MLLSFVLVVQLVSEADKHDCVRLEQSSVAPDVCAIRDLELALASDVFVFDINLRRFRILQAEVFAFRNVPEEECSAVCSCHCVV